MIVHQHKGMDFEAESLGDFSQEGQEPEAIGVTEEQAGAAVGAAGDVAPTAGHEHAQGSGHKADGEMEMKQMSIVEMRPQALPSGRANTCY